jgi:hypothetical protein
MKGLIDLYERHWIAFAIVGYFALAAAFASEYYLERMYGIESDFVLLSCIFVFLTASLVLQRIRSSRA